MSDGANSNSNGAGSNSSGADSKSSGKSMIGQFALAIVIVGLLSGSIIGVLVLLYLQNDNLNHGIMDAMKSNNATGLINTYTTVYDRVGQNNSGVYNLILPSLTTALGTIVAFYFGSKNLQIAQEVHAAQVQSMQTAYAKQIAAINSPNLPDMTIAELLKYYPDMGNPITVKSTDLVGDVKQECTKFGNVIVTDENGKPLGILYGSSLLSLGNDQATLESNFSNMVDPITRKTWSAGPPNNFASLTLRDLVSDAKKKMDDIKSNDPRVRGLVVDGTKVSYIVNYQMLTQPLSAK